MLWAALRRLLDASLKPCGYLFGDDAGMTVTVVELEYLRAREIAHGMTLAQFRVYANQHSHIALSSDTGRRQILDPMLAEVTHQMCLGTTRFEPPLSIDLMELIDIRTYEDRLERKSRVAW